MVRGRLLATLLVVLATFGGCIGADEPLDPSSSDNETASNASAGANATDAATTSDNTTPEESPSPEDPDQENGTDASEGNQSRPQEPLNRTALPQRLIDPTQRFHMNATACTESLVIVPTTEEAARRFVPGQYTLATDPTGAALAFAGLKRCSNMTLNDLPIGNASTSDVGVLLESPDGTEGIHYYQTWWTTDNRHLWRAIRDQGWRSGLAEDTSAITVINGAVHERSFRIDWFEGAYELSVRGATGDPVEPTVATGWHEGVVGTLSVSKVLANNEQGAGAGVVTAEPGSPMAELIGGTEAVGSGLLATYSMTGTVGPVQA